jgi:hypothetical protein
LLIVVFLLVAMPVAATTPPSAEARDDDPQYASSPHERLDLSVDSQDVVFNESSDAELETALVKAGFQGISSMELDAPSPARGPGTGHAHVVSGKISFPSRLMITQLTSPILS